MSRLLAPPSPDKARWPVIATNVVCGYVPPVSPDLSSFRGWRRLCDVVFLLHGGCRLACQRDGLVARLDCSAAAMCRLWNVRDV